MRKPHPLVELARLPWWASAFVASMVFMAARWLGPALAAGHPILAPLAAAAANYAAWLAGIFLIPIPFALVHAARRRRLAATQPRLDTINALSWQDFEALVAEVYRRKGYGVVERGGPSADGGIDLELRAKRDKIVVQCKRWKTRVVGVDRVRELYGAMTAEGASAAIMVCSGRYTPDAIAFARDKPIELVAGPELVEMLAGIQLRQESAATPTGVPDAGLSTAKAAVAASPKAAEAVSCPKCGSAMVRRVAKQGSRAGSSFWGCSRFPACLGTLSTE
jgi:restriction system protein